MNSVLLWIAGLLVVLLGSLFAVPYFVDWNSYRGVFEAEASRIIGREVRVGGDVDLRLLPAPRLSEYDELSCRVSQHSTIRVKKVTYSVPARLIGQQVRVEV